MSLSSLAKSRVASGRIGNQLQVQLSFIFQPNVCGAQQEQLFLIFFVSCFWQPAQLSSLSPKRLSLTQGLFLDSSLILFFLEESGPNFWAICWSIVDHFRHWPV